MDHTIPSPKDWLKHAWFSFSSKSLTNLSSFFLLPLLKGKRKYKGLTRSDYCYKWLQWGFNHSITISIPLLLEWVGRLFMPLVACASVIIFFFFFFFEISVIVFLIMINPFFLYWWWEWNFFVVHFNFKFLRREIKHLRDKSNFKS